ncbi:NADH dehydrogenase subunit 6 (mitochondrion) [Nilaparvata lugens]|uniref:NADH dehydrogenase subunit 6 n=1 Tax=Nilaparvata lugens TaxID=108931 RepID=S4TIR1_NILLU|nr:NADH dehydrogenase subunit 6 [Nilaparvata lugens]UVW80479.1 NADH dehydrogenase subunit 6 [Leptocorisa oratoria]AEP27262.1 NADH dehydrogenase subunit 6 [Nilaparvata lugens]AEP27275.1 NADH dehydrogenase subunit 6 [Nilaparvata lugens]AEP27288.1 NADH dehydrogenase subunit 6 [Nilaparvata lugens]AGC22534.1 NADH dehydrogenase subunit 6 [Nilaparvata lugens]
MSNCIKFIQVSLILNSIMSMFMNHPISLGTTLMIQSISTSLFMNLLTKNSWNSMILFITFSSGLMIMFMYMASISSNEKFKWSLKLFLMIMCLMLTSTVMKEFMIMNKFNMNEQSLFIQDNEEKKSIMKIIGSNKILLFILVTLIILMVLFSISNLINSFEGPLKKTYEKLKILYRMIN